MTTPKEEINDPPPKITTPHIEEKFERCELTNELYLPLTSTLVLKCKQEMLYVPLDFESNLTKDALPDSRAYVRVKSSKSLILRFFIQAANGQLEKPSATVKLSFDIGKNTFAEQFLVMKILTGPIIGLCFSRNDSVVIETTHVVIHFPHLMLQVKTTSNETSAKPQPVLTDESLTIQPRTTKTITAFVDHPSEWNKTGTVIPLDKFTETASLLISHSMSALLDNTVAVRVTNTLEFSFLIKNNTQIPEFFIVTPEQSK